MSRRRREVGTRLVCVYVYVYIVEGVSNKTPCELVPTWLMGIFETRFQEDEDEGPLCMYNGHPGIDSISPLFHQRCPGTASGSYIFRSNIILYRRVQLLFLQTNFRSLCSYLLINYFCFVFCFIWTYFDLRSTSKKKYRLMTGFIDKNWLLYI